MWELDYKESWALKNGCLWTVVLEKTLENPLDCKEIQPVYPKGNQSWIFIGRSDAEAETPILWPPDAKNCLVGKDPDARKDWRREEKGQQRVKWLDGITDSMDRVWVNSESWWWTRKSGVLQSMGTAKSQTLLSGWTELSIVQETQPRIIKSCPGQIRVKKIIIVQEHFISGRFLNFIFQHFIG